MTHHLGIDIRRHSANAPCRVASLCTNNHPSNNTLLFFFNDTATTEIYTLSLHDALPICLLAPGIRVARVVAQPVEELGEVHRSEEHTSELQSRLHLVCRLLLEKKKNDSCQDGVHHVPHCDCAGGSSCVLAFRSGVSLDTR